MRVCAMLYHFLHFPISEEKLTNFLEIKVLKVEQILITFCCYWEKWSFLFGFQYLIVKDKILKISSISEQHLNVLKQCLPLILWFKLLAFFSPGFSLFGCCITLYFLNLPFVAGSIFESNLEDSKIFSKGFLDFFRPVQYNTSMVQLCRTAIPWQNWIISNLKLITCFSGMLNS